MHNTPTTEEILAARDCSGWLKAALQSALDRDPADAANDAALLASVLAARADSIVAVEVAKLGLTKMNRTREQDGGVGP